MLSPIGKYLTQLGGAGTIAALLFVFRDRNPVAVLAFFMVALIMAAMVFGIIVHVMPERRMMKRLEDRQSKTVATKGREIQ